MCGALRAAPRAPRAPADFFLYVQRPTPCNLEGIINFPTKGAKFQWRSAETTCCLKHNAHRRGNKDNNKQHIASQSQPIGFGAAGVCVSAEWVREPALFFFWISRETILINLYTANYIFYNYDEQSYSRRRRCTTMDGWMGILTAVDAMKEECARWLEPRRRKKAQEAWFLVYLCGCLRRADI